MKCEVRHERGGVVIVCGSRKGRSVCTYCAATATKLCDFVIRGRPGIDKARTCDRPVCEQHATALGPNKDHCDDHKHESGKLSL